VSLGLSLVSIESIEVKDLLSFPSVHDRNLSLTPSHFGLLESSAYAKNTLEIVKALDRHKLRVTSLQGLTFGLGTGDGFSRASVERRAKEIASVAEDLNVSTLVLGAPSLRTYREDWDFVIESFGSAAHGKDFEIVLETICNEFCDNTIESTLGLLGGSLGIRAIALDASNTSGCEYHLADYLAHQYSSIAVLHISGINHSQISSEKEAHSVSELIGKSKAQNKAPDIFWEIFAETIDDLRIKVLLSEEALLEISSPG
jgi:hypothetical protein